MAPLVDLGVDLKWGEPVGSLRNDGVGATRLNRVDDPVCIKGFVGQQRIEFNALNERRHADRVVAIAGQQFEADEIAERVRERQDLGR